MIGEEYILGQQVQQHIIMLNQRQANGMQQLNFSEVNNRVNSIVCYLCGREFGTRGFAFHHKECKIKFLNQQRIRPVQAKTKVPEPPQGINHVLEGQFSQIDLKKFNALSNQIHKYKVLPACKYCGRTFNYESLAPHMKGCEKQKGFKEEKENNNEAIIRVPKNLVCCVCGQRFGTLSLKIHYPQCTKKFINDEFRKHKKEGERRKPPQFDKDDESLIKTKTEWQDDQLQSFNNRAMEMYRNKSMAECFNCKRKFFDEQLPKHQKNCVLINGTLNTIEKVQKKEVEVKKPRTIMCMICGRDYGQASISIHAESCAELFQKQQNLKRKNEKKALPQLPAELSEEYNIKQAGQWTIDKIEAYNKLVSNIYNTKSLAKCYVCQRTFFEESLPKHLKDCESKLKDVRKLQKFKKQVRSKSSLFGQNFIEEVIQMNKQINKLPQKSSAKPKVLMCFLCGKEYGLLSLKIHLPQCKQKTSNNKRLQDENFQKLCSQIEVKYNISSSQTWNSSEIEAFNKEVYSFYKKQSLFECKYCHRTFFQESLAKHIKHCQKNSEKQTAKDKEKQEISHEKQQIIQQSQQINNEEQQISHEQQQISLEEQSITHINEKQQITPEKQQISHNNEDQQIRHEEQQTSSETQQISHCHENQQIIHEEQQQPTHHDLYN